MKTFIMIIAILFVLCILEIIRETHSFITKRYSIFSDKIKVDGIRIAFLSDLHTSSYGENNKKLMQRMQIEKPDLILIGGDMLLGKKGQDFLALESLLLALRQLAPVYYALGNHEQKLKVKPAYGDSFERFEKKLKQAKIQLLDNKCTIIECKEQQILLTGLSIPTYYFKKSPTIKFTRTDYERVCPKLESTREVLPLHILLAHNPTYMETYLQGGADIILSGHFHGGLVRIPYFRGLMSTQFQLFPYYSGEMRIKRGQYCVVSRGLGHHTLPIRLFNQAEVVILELRSK